MLEEITLHYTVADRWTKSFFYHLFIHSFNRVFCVLATILKDWD